MRCYSVMWKLSPLAAMLLVGCAQVASRDQVVDRLTRSESQVVPDEAVWMGDSGGYHYIHVRNVYSYTGDQDYLVPVSQWDLPDSFPLTDDANRWRNVTWEDKDALMRSRFAYVLVQPLERIDSPSVKSPQSQPTSEPTTQPNPPASAPVTQP